MGFVSKGVAALAALLACLVGCTAPAGPEGLTHVMQVIGVEIDPRTSSPMMLLQEETGARRRLPIWIGIHEARSIALALENVSAPRPNSHDLIQNIVHGIDAKVSRVIITELRAGTYYAVLEIELSGKRVAIDSRPSDAIAVAMRTGTSILATEELLDQAGLSPVGGAPLDIDWKTRAPRDAGPPVHAH